MAKKIFISFLIFAFLVASLNANTIKITLEDGTKLIAKELKIKNGVAYISQDTPSRIPYLKKVPLSEISKIEWGKTNNLIPIKISQGNLTVSVLQDSLFLKTAMLKSQQTIARNTTVLATIASIYLAASVIGIALILFLPSNSSK